MPPNRRVTVFGGYGHTGRFVVAELRKRGATPIAAGRDAARLRAMRTAYPDLETRAANVAYWHQWPDEYDFVIQKWDEFLSA